jgi:tRNA dimethylallyltransferase
MIIICGPTAVGKTKLGLCLAKKFNGEILSADSRQVYKGMNIGTGKDVEKAKGKKSKLKSDNDQFSILYYEVGGIKVWGMDIVKPDYPFSVGEYQKVAEVIIKDINKRGKIPIVVGGTGLYLKVFTDNLSYINIPPDERIREGLKLQSVKALQKVLSNYNNAKLISMNNSDRNNPRRLIRAIEIAKYLETNQIHLGSSTVIQQSKKIVIGLKTNNLILFEKIKIRIQERLKNGLISEIKSLLKHGYNWDLQSMSGLGYKEFQDYIKHKKNIKETIDQWRINEQNYAKRQIGWFKKINNVLWFDTTDKNFYPKIYKLIGKFLF